jgi:hypothetical protein
LAAPTGSQRRRRAAARGAARCRAADGAPTQLPPPRAPRSQELLERALSTREELLGVEHAEAAVTKQHLASICYAMLCYAMPCYAMPCYAMLCYAVLCYAMLCNAVMCYVMLCYAMLCCYTML